MTLQIQEIISPVSNSIQGLRYSVQNQWRCVSETGAGTETEPLHGLDSMANSYAN